MGREELVALVSLYSCVALFPDNTHYIICGSFAFNFACYWYQTCFLSLRRISFLKIFLVK